MGLSFRVRDGTGRFPHAMTAVTLVHQPPLFFSRGGVPMMLLGRPGGVGVNLYRFVFLPPSVVPHPDHYWFRGGVSQGVGFVGQGPPSGREQSYHEPYT